MRQIPQIAIDFIKQHEACKLKSYRDSGGVLTNGYGHTGPNVRASQTITQQIADINLNCDLVEARKRIYGVVKPEIVDGDLTDNQFAALLSFVFNLGANPAWTIWKRLNAKQFDQVPGEMMRFVNCGGHKLQGLVNRRTAEVALWSEAEPGSVPDSPPSSVTRAQATPATPTDPDPPQKSKTMISAAASALAVAPVAVKQVSDAVSPYADHSALAAHMVAGLATVGTLAAVATVVFYWIHKNKARN